MIKKKQIQCETCLRWFDEDEIYYEADPFNEEINGDSTPIWQCADCIQESADDI